MIDLLENLNVEQKKAVTHVDGPLLIVAGAGTGKTTVITRRIAYLLEQNLAKPHEILALTFTEKAATEMEERVDKLLPLGTFDINISTFHAFCERILKQHALDIGIPNGFKLLDDAQRWILLYKNFNLLNLNYYKPLGNPNKFIDALLYHFDKCKDELITPESYLEFAESLKLKAGHVELDPGSEDAVESARVEEVARAFHVYQKLLLDNEYLDFGDLINYCLQLFKQRPRILSYYQKQFKYLMVDEFQDTNYAQYQLVKMLSSDNLVVVGDDDQSIYKFRGASVSNILKLKEDFPKIEEITLVKNYRSAQNILDLAYSFIQSNNPARLEATLGINKKLTNPLKPEAGVIEVLEGKDLNEEINLVIQKIVELKTKFADSSWNDFVVLIRANSAANEILPKLESSQIPYYFVANRGLYKKPLIAELISYLKLLSNLHDSASLYSVLRLSIFRLPAEDLAKLSQFSYQKTLSLYETLNQPEIISKISPGSQNKVKTLLNNLALHSQKSQETSATELFVYVIKDLGIDQELSEETFENAQGRELLEQFYKKIEKHAENNTNKTLKAFIDDLTLEMTAGDEGEIKFDTNSGPESLKVMTIHATKGLEFKFVFIVNLVDQRFPTRQRRETIEIPESLINDILPEGDFHLQEERRLFYVAVTRAKSHLYLSWAKDYGGKQIKKPSLFLLETKLVPSEKINKATGKVIFSKPKVSKKKVVYKELPKSYSYSAITQFLKCPLDYKYRYYLRLPLPGSASLSFGTTIHKTLQNFLESYLSLVTIEQVDQKLPSLKVLLELYEKNWVDDWYASKLQKTEYKEKGKIILEKFYEACQNLEPKPKFLESSFKLELGKKKYSFTGKIDRADIGADGLEILDYKTGKIPSGDKAGDIDQLRIYQWAAQEYLQEKVTSLKYWYLESGEFRAVPLATDGELTQLKNKLEETIKQIEKAITYDLFAELHKKTSRHDCGLEHLR